MNILKNLLSYSSDDTEKFGKELALAILADKALPKFIAIYGDLGVGKTAFVRGFVSVVSPTSAVKSPTFTIVNEYRKSSISVFHFDMYRINDEDDLLSIGFYDYLSRDGICIVEWSEKIPFAIPDTYFSVKIEKIADENENSRKITVELIQG